jgi:phosphatidylethanolamine/phosphatidyl-N-methylethanolamine N-methyltransferase
MPASSGWKDDLVMPRSLKFFSEFIMQPGSVGAVWSSSHSLRRKMLEWIDWENASVIIEYGPGTGVFTDRILSAMRPDTKFFAIEINPAFTQMLRRRFPELQVYQNSVQHVQDICRMEGVDQVDAIISGLPWALIPEQAQNCYLDATFGVLKPGGQFATFAYLTGLMLPEAKRFKVKLSRRFTEVQKSKVSWLNVPPAFVYRCRR